MLLVACDEGTRRATSGDDPSQGAAVVADLQDLREGWSQGQGGGLEVVVERLAQQDRVTSPEGLHEHVEDVRLRHLAAATQAIALGVYRRRR